ncbi:MAG: carboxylesterase [Shewanellaceae bacterium]|nr:carboxylesterase [Shewanellaceae bacterium]
MNKLSKIIIEPRQPAEACVILMHGLGDSAAGIRPVVDALNLQDSSIRFVLPDAPMRPITINQGMTMRGWYDIQQMALTERADVGGITVSENLIVELMDEQIAEGITSQKLALVGFSQGGVMALHTGLRYQQPLAGLVGMSCYLPQGDTLPTDTVQPSSNLNVALYHGRYDPVVPLAAGQMARKTLVAAGFAVDWSVYDMEHNIVAEEIGRLRHCLLRWLAD